VIRRDGLEHASVRNVAREAGLSSGSLRHMFRTQAELLVFAMNQVVDRIESRLDSLDPTGDPRRDRHREGEQERDAAKQQATPSHRLSLLPSAPDTIAARPASSRATGTRNGEQET